MSQSSLYTTFSSDDIRALEPALKIGILATVNDDGLPHLTLISSLKANTPTQMTWGQFTEGLSKSFIRISCHKSQWYDPEKSTVCKNKILKIERDIINLDSDICPEI